MHYMGGTSPPKDPAKWYAFIAQVFQGLVERYGAAEVRTWRIEVWNEPQGCGFFCPPNRDNLAAYLSLYNTTASAIASVDPFIPVGGPATAALAWVPEFINYTAATKAPAAFVSTHSYPTDYRNPSHRTEWEEGVLANADIAKKAGFPYVMTEFSAGLSNEAYDAPFAASFIVHATAALLAATHIPTMSFWTFTDIFEEPGFDSNAWAQTFGIQTKYGVPKPAYRALQLLARFPKVSEAHMCGASRCTAPNQATPSTLPLVHCPARRPHMLFPHKIQLFLGPTFPLTLVFFYNPLPFC